MFQKRNSGAQKPFSCGVILESCQNYFKYQNLDNRKPVSCEVILENMSKLIVKLKS